MTVSVPWFSFTSVSNDPSPFHSGGFLFRVTLTLTLESELTSAGSPPSEALNWIWRRQFPNTGSHTMETTNLETNHWWTNINSNEKVQHVHYNRSVYPRPGRVPSWPTPLLSLGWQWRTPALWNLLVFQTSQYCTEAEMWHRIAIGKAKPKCENASQNDSCVSSGESS